MGNLWEIEFKCKITWNFFTTSHGKEAVNSIHTYPTMHAITPACTGTHTSTFTCAIYRRCKIMIFSLFVLFWYISCKENIPKRGVHSAWKLISFELLSWMFETTLYTWITYRKQIFYDFSSQPAELKLFYGPIVDKIFKLFIIISSYNGLFCFKRKYFVMV